jgi:hypothetical protein
MKTLGIVLAAIGSAGFVIVVVRHNLAIRRLRRMMRDIEDRRNP